MSAVVVAGRLRLRAGRAIACLAAIALGRAVVRADPRAGDGRAPAGPAAGDPCPDAVTDPASTPVRDAALDAQRSACLRDEVAAGITAHALIDTPGFHGVLGGDLALAGRIVVGERIELAARLRLIDYAFVQTAVNKVTDTRFGPLAVGAAYGFRVAPRARGAVVAAVELPFTRDQLATIRSSGQLTAVVTGALAPRWLVHGRLGAIGAFASSAGGDVSWFALRAGIDLACRATATLTVLGGAEAQAGWYTGLDTIVARAGLQLRPRGGRWRGSLGIGAPLGGDERTNAIVSVGIARDLD